MMLAIRCLAAGVGIALLSSATAFAAEFRCGKEFITFETTGQSKTGPILVVTVQKRMIVMLMGPDGESGVVAIGRDGVPHTSANYITPDTYRNFIRCLD